MDTTNCPPTQELTLERAVELVVSDQRESFPEMTEIEALAYARYTLCFEDIQDNEPGCGHDECDELARAYRMVLSAGSNRE